MYYIAIIIVLVMIITELISSHRIFAGVSFFSTLYFPYWDRGDPVEGRGGGYQLLINYYFNTLLTIKIYRMI